MSRDSLFNLFIFLGVLFLTILSIILVLNFIGNNVINNTSSFESSCESFGGSYWEIQNVTCDARYPNCRYMCSLNGEMFSMSDLGKLGYFSYAKQICIKDCRYKNEQAGEIMCVC